VEATSALSIRWLADAVLVLHVAFIVFVVGGLVAVVLGNLRGWRWVNAWWLRATHLAAIGFVVAESVFDMPCPFTTLEAAIAHPSSGARAGCGPAGRHPSGLAARGGGPPRRHVPPGGRDPNPVGLERTRRVIETATIDRMADPPPSVDAYIAAFPPEVQAILRKVRATVLAAAPEAREIISYRMPALRQHGVLVYYAAFKRHIGFYPPIKGDAKLQRAAARYAGDKGNLRFPLDQPIPYPLIERLTKLRARQDAAAAKAKRR
jgi:uncharacterized protein YdhG (YjbR/CyaY superfamily)